MNIPNFVIDELEKVAKNEGLIDYEIQQEPGSKHGEGFMAKMLAVTLIGKKYIGDQLTVTELHLMCKLLPENLDRREMFDSSSIFENEIYFYNKVLRAFEQFQCDKNITIEDRFIEYPKCYGTASDFVRGEHVIIMENLRSIGYGLWDKTKPIDYETVCLYMNVLGKLHALSFALHDQKPKLFDELSDFKDVFVRLLERDDTFEKILIAGLDKGLSVLDRPEEREILENLRDNCREETLRLLSKGLAAKFYVLGHGDSWNNNLFYSSGESVR